MNPNTCGSYRAEDMVKANSCWSWCWPFEQIYHHTSSAVFQGSTHCERPMASSHLASRVVAFAPDLARGLLCTNESARLVDLSNGDKMLLFFRESGPMAQRRIINIDAYVHIYVLLVYGYRMILCEQRRSTVIREVHYGVHRVRLPKYGWCYHHGNRLPRSSQVECRHCLLVRR